VISHLLREFILPPSSLILLLALSFGLRHRKPRHAAAIFVVACSAFYLLSIPLVSATLARSTERKPAITLEQARLYEPQAVVILGAGVDFNAAEYGGRSVPSAVALKRISYAAYLAKNLSLPVVTTGGYGDSADDSEGRTAARYLENIGFAQPVLVESNSQSTQENALFCKPLLEGKNIHRLLLVTQASHAARAEAAFRKAGFEVMAAPTGFRSPQPWERDLLLIVPTHSHFNESCGALRTHLAALYESLRA
jgi:uncharacterized SAM-binding protein YcdF (DUF218 family)